MIKALITININLTIKHMRCELIARTTNIIFVQSAEVVLFTFLLSVTDSVALSVSICPLMASVIRLNV